MIKNIFESLTKSKNNKLIESKVDEESDNVYIESCFMLESDILKSLISLPGSCPKWYKRSIEITNNSPLKK